MTNVLFLLIGIVVLDILMSHNRRRFPQQPPQYWDGMPPYTPPTYAPPTHFSPPHYAPFQHESAQYPPYRRETSPVFATLIFMVIVVFLMFWLSS